MSTTNASDLIDGQVTSFAAGAVVQLINGGASSGLPAVAEVMPATITVTPDRVAARAGTYHWTWLTRDISDVIHGVDEPWSILIVPGVPDHGVAVAPTDGPRFRSLLGRYLPGAVAPALAPRPESPTPSGWSVGGDDHGDPSPEPHPTIEAEVVEPDKTNGSRRRGLSSVAGRLGRRTRPADAGENDVRPELAGIEARAISAWFGTHHVLDRISLDMAAGEVTALIGPSGCGKSTFLRILNRMHEMIPSASLGGQVLLDGADIYDAQRRVTDARRQIGMVFQKPNPFPAMSIYDNVVASYRLTGTKVTADEKDDVVESCLRKAGLWNEVRDRLRSPGGGLSGGQQQRLCIARALAIRPRVLLMDEPCSALDPTSTRRIEETIGDLRSEVTIVIVTHNMQQASRVSDRCAFFLAEQGTPGVIVEHGPTSAMFASPQDQRTMDYVTGRFG